MTAKPSQGLARPLRIVPSPPAPETAERCICPHCAGAGTVRLPLDLVPYMPALVRTVGGMAFSTRELLAHAALIGGELHDVLRDREPRAIGRALQRLSGQSVDGFALTKIGNDGKSAVWMFLPETGLR